MGLLSRTTTILFIDPNGDERQYWKERLNRSSLHYKVFEAGDGEAGLAISKSQRIDCVVIELGLPGMSGFQVLLRLNPIAYSCLQTPVVALSHFILPSIVQAARKLGAQSYLIKSQASGDDLHRAIQDAIAILRGLTPEDVHKAA
jgi:DNA-binding NarL/FixJ family response regulator